MQPLTSNKWRNTLLLGAVFFGIILLAEVLPLAASAAEAVWQYAASAGNTADAESMKHNLNYELGRKKQLAAIRKSLLAASARNASSAGLIETIDSLGRACGCRLISVQPFEEKGGKGTAVKFSFRTGYSQLYRMMHSLGKLPLLFTIRELHCAEGTEQTGEMTAVLQLSLVNSAEGRK